MRQRAGEQTSVMALPKEHDLQPDTDTKDGQWTELQKNTHPKKNQQPELGVLQVKKNIMLQKQKNKTYLHGEKKLYLRQSHVLELKLCLSDHSIFMLTLQRTNACTDTPHR